MQLEERIQLLVRLGQHLQAKDEYLEALMKRAEFNNGWFTLENQQKALSAIASQFLNEEKLNTWLSQYELTERADKKTVGLILAGNIPMVGFHDLLCVFVAGHRSKIKLSDKDQFVLPYLIKLLGEFNPAAQNYFEITTKLSNFDAVIATGSNNSARYFEAYFGKYPNIIRKNRNAVAILTGEEEHTELFDLGKDIFQFFGLGCRNVAKVYVPKDYDFEPLLEALHEYRDIINHTKYKNNFDYNYALYVLNKDEYRANGCIILTENKAIQSRIAGLHYEFFDNLEQLEQEMKSRAEEIQCIVAKPELIKQPTIGFGQAQEPELWDYADGVDTLEFLRQL